MLRSMNTGVSGMQAQQQALSVIANNIANDQTVGYKMQEAIFEELFYLNQRTPMAPTNENAGSNSMDIGNGVKLGGVNTIHTQGNVTYSGNKTDVAIQGEGFFVVGDGNGENRYYTRAGNFTVNKNNQLSTKSGQYVLGWNVDPLSGKINTGANLSPVTINLGEISKPNQSTSVALEGNLKANAKQGDTIGLQIPSWDRLGGRHDINIDFVKGAGNSYSFIATPTDQFKPSGHVNKAILLPSEGVAAAIQKGDYQITTAASATAGKVDITVTAPDGSTVLTQTVSDVNQAIKLNDGTKDWFSIDYKAGGAHGTATVTVGEVGTIAFDSNGQVQNIANEKGNPPVISYTPNTTGTPVDIKLDMTNFTGFSADSAIRMTQTDGMGASKLENFEVADGGIIQGYYSDGTVRSIGLIATASFSNPAGLTNTKQGLYVPSGNSGEPEIGVPGTGTRGGIKSKSIEGSNVDLAKQFTDMMQTQKSFQANTKTIRVSDEILTDLIQLIR